MKEGGLTNLQKLIITVATICAVGLFILLNVTSPDSASPTLFLTIFILMYGATFGFFTVTAVFFVSLNRLLFPNVIKKKPRSPRKIISYIAIISSVPIFILAIQSIKPVSVLEVLLVLLLASVAGFAIHKKQ